MIIDSGGDGGSYTLTDQLDGGAGNDTIISNSTEVVVSGGPGDDVIDLTGATYWGYSTVNWTTGDGNDTLVAPVEQGHAGTSTVEVTSGPVGYVDFGVLTPSDLTLEIKNYSYVYIDPEGYAVNGDFYVVIKSSNESLHVGIDVFRSYSDKHVTVDWFISFGGIFNGQEISNPSESIAQQGGFMLA